MFGFDNSHSSYLPDTVSMRPLEYRRYDAMGVDANTLCLWIGLAAFALFYVKHSCDANSRRAVALPMQAVSGMIARLGDAIQLGEDDAAPLLDGATGVAKRIDATHGSTPAKNLAKLRAFLEKHSSENVCVVFFAHWCGHCQQMLRDMAAQAKDLRANDVTYLLVNAESVSSEAFAADGPHSVVHLQYYPTICTNRGSGTELVQVSSLVTGAAASAAAPKEEESTTDDLFAALF